MSIWECRVCTTAYAVGMPGCPQCGATDPIEEAEQLRRENEMAKITVHGGPSNEDAEPGQPGYVEPAAVAEQVETDTAEPAEPEPAKEQPKPGSRAASRRRDSAE